MLRQNETKATFFVVGELLEFKPELLDLILENDHEIGFHTMKHTRIDSLNFKEEFDDEIKRFDHMTNGKSKGFRAPSFSLNKKSSWVIDSLEKNGTSMIVALFLQKQVCTEFQTQKKNHIKLLVNA